MLKRFRKMITNRVPGVFENECFSDKKILFKLKTACCTVSSNLAMIT